MKIRDRIRELRRVQASELRPNPKNWRTHPVAQRDALRGLLAEIGYADALLARECPDGSLELIDGHLRAETTPDQLVPVLVLDVDEQEAAKLLATLDPLAGLAECDTEQLDALLADLDFENLQVKQMLAQLVDASNGNAMENDTGEKDMPADDQTDKLGEKYQILIECTDEAQQADLLARLTSEGLSCRALIA